MTVVEAIKVVLSQSSDSMTSQEIYTQIAQRNLYQFAAKTPSSIVLSALRRHCQGLDFPTSSPMKHFQIGQPKRGKTTYRLIRANTSGTRARFSWGKPRVCAPFLLSALRSRPASSIRIACTRSPILCGGAYFSYSGTF